MPSDLPKFTLRTDKQTLDKFRVVAQKNLRTVNRELEMLMRQHIADYEDKQENQQRSRAEKQDAMIICQIAPLVKPPADFFLG